MEQLLELIKADPTFIVVLLSFLFALVSFIISLFKVKNPGGVENLNKSFDDLKSATSLLASGMSILLKDKENKDEKDSQ